jgi:hypothetical protein
MYASGIQSYNVAYNGRAAASGDVPRGEEGALWILLFLQ